jgi:hypothetical protein
MRVKLSKDWRRWAKGKELTGGAAREALADKAGKVMKPGKAEEAAPEEE